MRITPQLQSIVDDQYGIVTRRQLRNEGHSRHQIDALIKKRWLIPFHPGVFRVAGSKPSFEQDLLAACFVNGRGSIVTHRAACRLWGIDLGLPPIVEVSAPRSSSPRTPGIVVHRPRRIDGRHLVELGVFGVTTPARTVADLGAVVPKAIVATAMEQVLRKRWSSAAFLRYLCTELDNPQRLGPPVLLEALDERLVGQTPSDSDVELEMAELCRNVGVPVPVFQFEIVIDGKKKRIDFAFPELKIAIEVDGWEEHLKFAKFQGDRVRRNELELRGWHVFNFTWNQIVHQKPYVGSTLLRLLDAYGPDLVGALCPH